MFRMVEGSLATEPRGVRAQRLLNTELSPGQNKSSMDSLSHTVYCLYLVNRKPGRMIWES
jgi:hypothetical protein